MYRKIRCDGYCANFFGLHGQLNRPKSYMSLLSQSRAAPHVSVALGEINICTRGWSSGTLDSLNQRTQAGNTELYFSSIVDLEYKQAMPCVMYSIVLMFLYGCTQGRSQK
jgi:hypothetical protein